MYCCATPIERCQGKSQVTTINQTRNACLEFCVRQTGPTTDMYSSPCGRFCQFVVDQKIKQYGYSPCEKKIQPAVFWYPSS